MRPHHALSTCFLAFAVACGGKTAGIGSGGPGSSSGGSTGSSGGGSGSSSSGSDGATDANPGLACGTPVPSGDREAYCCSMAPSMGCLEDPQWTTHCTGPMPIGYMCSAGEDPVSDDPTLTCGPPSTDAAMRLFYYCCTY